MNSTLEIAQTTPGPEQANCRDIQGLKNESKRKVGTNVQTF